MKDEIWKEVEGTGGVYEISNFGRLKRNKTTRKHIGDNNVAILPETIPKGFIHNGYLKYSITVNGVQLELLAHRLIAKAFIPNPENKPCINHKNGIKSDNSLDNLEWCTKAENNQHAFDIGLRRGAKPKFVIQRDRQGNYIKTHRSILEASKDAGICRSNIKRHLRKERPTAGGYVWELVDQTNF